MTTTTNDTNDKTRSPWERVATNPQTYRLRVQAGWLYRVEDDNSTNTVTMCFVPDVVHIYDMIQRVSRGAPLFVKGH